MARNKARASTVRRLHRSIGAGTAVFIIFMVLSGLAINHSNGLGLDQHHMSQAGLLDWYGLEEPEQINSFALGSNWLSFAGSQLYLNDKPVSTITNGVGAVAGEGMLIAAGSEELLLLDHDGNLIERIAWDSPGSGPIESIGLLTGDVVAVKSANQLWLADTDLLGWQQAGNIHIDPIWSKPAPVPTTIHQAITRQYRGAGISMERVLLDVHSGRIFGPIGIFIYDLLALAVGFLAVSGLVFWLRGRRKSKQNGIHNDSIL